MGGVCVYMVVGGRSGARGGGGGGGGGGVPNKMHKFKKRAGGVGGCVGRGRAC